MPSRRVHTPDCTAVLWWSTAGKVEKFGANAPLGHTVNRWKSRRFMSPLAARENSYTSGQVWCSDGGPEPSNVYDLCVESDF